MSDPEKCRCLICKQDKPIFGLPCPIGWRWSVAGNGWVCIDCRGNATGLTTDCHPTHGCVHPVESRREINERADQWWCARCGAWRVAGNWILPAIERHARRRARG